MDKFKYFHLCDHKINRKHNDYSRMTFDVTNQGTPIDILIQGAVVQRIHEVRVLEYDEADYEPAPFKYDDLDENEEKILYDEVVLGRWHYDEATLFVVDYSRYFIFEQDDVSEHLPPSFYDGILHNRIRWSVKPPIKYRVVADVTFSSDSKVIHDSIDCPVCGGKGWFIDLFDKNGTFQEPRGPYKIAQRVVKGLLTTRGTQVFDENYGTTLKTDAMVQSSQTDSDLEEMIIAAVSDVEQQYLMDQNSIEQSLPEDERLNSLIVEDVGRHSVNKTVILIRIRIITPASNDVFQLGL